MKILFFSDIHGIITNLEYIDYLEEQNSFDKIVVLGDLYYSGTNQPMEDSLYVKEFLMKYQEKLICLKGNCDSDVDIKSSDFPICNNLVLINVDGLDIYCTHGNEYNMEKNRKFNCKGILVHGHLHYPFIEKQEEMIYINTGSISLPRRNSKPSYLIYEDKLFTLYTVNGDIIDSIKL